MDTPAKPRWAIIREEGINAYRKAIADAKSQGYQIVREVDEGDAGEFAALITLSPSKPSPKFKWKGKAR